MTIHTFAADHLTTFADVARRPALDPGQLARILALVVVVALTFAAAAHRNAAAAGPTPAPIERAVVGR